MPATRFLIVAFASILAALIAFGSLAAGIRGNELTALDEFVTPFLHSHASALLDTVMNVATTIGSDLVILPVSGAVIVILAWHRRRWEAVFLAAAVAGSVALNGLMKVLFQRPRPKLPWAHLLPDYSFPSGHAMNSVVFYLALALVAWAIFGRRTGLAATASAVCLALVIGGSRIYLGYHYFTDVLGGFAAGVAWVLMVAAAFNVRRLLTTSETRASATPSPPSG